MELRCPSSFNSEAPPLCLAPDALPEHMDLTSSMKRRTCLQEMPESGER
jgi:hypothetical protein